MGNAAMKAMNILVPREVFSPKAATRRPQDEGEGGGEPSAVYDHGTRDTQQPGQLAVLNDA